MDSALCKSGRLLEPEQRQEMHDLIVEARGAEDADEPLPLRLLQLYKVLQLKIYDASDAVNTFYIGGNPIWITPDERSNYMLTIEGAKRNSVPTVPFLGMDIPVDNAVAMIDAVNIYAMQCVGVTDVHEAAIIALDSTEAVAAYDFTTGYPEKLAF